MSETPATRWGIVGAGQISNDFVTAIQLLPEKDHKVMSFYAAANYYVCLLLQVKFCLHANDLRQMLRYYFIYTCNSKNNNLYVAK